MAERRSSEGSSVDIINEKLQGLTVNGWSLLTLKEHFTAMIQAQRDEFAGLILEAEKRNSQRFADQEKGVSTAMTANEKAVNAAMAAAEKLGNVQQLALDKAIQKAELAQSDKNASMNEIRKMAEDAQNRFAQIPVVNLQIDGLQVQIRALQVLFNEGKAFAGGNSSMLAWVIAVLGVGVAILSFTLKR